MYQGEGGEAIDIEWASKTSKQKLTYKLHVSSSQQWHRQQYCCTVYPLWDGSCCLWQRWHQHWLSSHWRGTDCLQRGYSLVSWRDKSSYLISIPNSNKTIYCKGISVNEGSSCKDCLTLTKNDTLLSVQDRIHHSIHPSTPFIYYLIGSLMALMCQKIDQLWSLKLFHLNDSWKLVGKVTALEDHNQWVMAVASKHID